MLQGKASEINELKDLNTELTQQLVIERQRADAANAKASEVRNNLELANNQLHVVGNSLTSLQSRIQEERNNTNRYKEELEEEKQRSQAAHNAAMAYRSEASDAVNEKRKLMTKNEQLDLQIKMLERNKTEAEVRFRSAIESLSSHHDEDMVMIKKYVEDGIRRNSELEAQKKELAESFWRVNNKLKTTEVKIHTINYVLCKSSCFLTYLYLYISYIYKVTTQRTD